MTGQILQTPDTNSSRNHWADKADSWVNWADPVAAMAEKFNRPFLEEIGLQPGDRVLDLASGAGEPALTAKEMVGPDGLVIATDFVPAMLSGIQNRDQQNTLALAAADMQKLPFTDQSFDRITCRFGIMFVPDVLKVAHECKRLLTPKGSCGFMIWGPEKDQTLFSVLSRACCEILETSPDPHYLSIFRFGEEDSLASSFREAGFSTVHENEIRHDSKVPADKPFWKAQLDMSYGHLLEDVSSQTKKAIEERVRELFHGIRDSETGLVTLNGHRRTLIAQI